MSQGQDFSKLQAFAPGAGAATDRTIHTFNIPASLSGYGVETVGLVELKAGEELDAAKRASGDQMRTAYELAQEALHYVNGQRVRTMDGTADAAFAKMHPKVRSLVISAYARLHSPEDADTKAFLESRQSQVG